MQSHATLQGRGFRSLQPMLLFLAVAIALLIADGFNGSTMQDVDDVARRLQIADLLKDGEWYDLTWPYIAMPEAYVSPWSRLVDFPYVVITTLLEPLFGQDRAFDAARFIVPLLWLVAYAWLAARLIHEILDEHPTLLQTGVAALASLFAIIEFIPYRIDHHNVQIVLLLAACLGLVSRHRLAGILLGLSIFLSVAVGLETLPYLIIGLTGVSVHAALAPQSNMPRKLLLTGLTLLIATLPLGFLLTGSTLAQTQCDTLAAPLASALMAGGLVAFGGPALWSVANLNTPWIRLSILVVGGAIALFAIWVSFPACHGGPYHMINETAHTYWLSNVIQEKGPIASFARGEQMLTLIFLAIVAMTLCGWMSVRTSRPEIVLLLVIATLGALLTAWQMRNFKFPAALLPLFVPLFIRMTSQTGNLRPLLTALVVPIICLGAMFAFVKPEGRALTLIDLMEGDTCKSADLTVFEPLPSSRILAPVGLSVTLAEHFHATGAPHTIAAMPFHRASDGMEKIFRTFVLTDANLRREALAPFDYVAVCTLPDTEADADLAPFFSALSSGDDWPGLSDVQDTPTSRLRLLEIDHDTVE